MFERGGYPQMQHRYAEHVGDGHPFVWLIFFLLLAVVVGVVGAFVLRRLAERRNTALPFSPAGVSAAGDALGVVRMRYARGEIDREQFLQANADLGGYPTAEPAPDTPTA